MAKISFKILNREGVLLKEGCAEEEVNLLYDAAYQEGDVIVAETDEKDAFYWLQLDDAKGSSLVYVKGALQYEIPFGEKRINLSPKVLDRKSVV